MCKQLRNRQITEVNPNLILKFQLNSRPKAKYGTFFKER
jgi:hypothetical protein